MCFDQTITFVPDASAKEETKSPTSVNENEQLNMKAVFLHVLGDALGSVVVIVSAMIIYFAEVSYLIL